MPVPGSRNGSKSPWMKGAFVAARNVVAGGNPRGYAGCSNGVWGGFRRAKGQEERPHGHTGAVTARRSRRKAGKPPLAVALQTPRLAHPVAVPHQQRQIEARHLNQEPLPVRPPHPPTIPVHRPLRFPPPLPPATGPELAPTRTSASPPAAAAPSWRSSGSPCRRPPPAGTRIPSPRPPGSRSPPSASGPASSCLPGPPAAPSPPPTPRPPGPPRARPCGTAASDRTSSGRSAPPGPPAASIPGSRSSSAAAGRRPEPPPPSGSRAPRPPPDPPGTPGSPSRSPAAAPPYRGVRQQRGPVHSRLPAAQQPRFPKPLQHPTRTPGGWASSEIRRRVLDRVEWSGERSVRSSARNRRKLSESATCQAIRRSESWPSKNPTSSIRKQFPGASPGRPSLSAWNSAQTSSARSSKPDFSRIPFSFSWNGPPRLRGRSDGEIHSFRCRETRRFPMDTPEIVLPEDTA